MATAVSPPYRAPITTHILDSTTGQPGKSVHATLSLLVVEATGRTIDATFIPDPAPTFTALTSEDGRISSWEPQSSHGSHKDFHISIDELFSKHEGSKMIWSLKFDTGKYWGKDKTFYPEVEVKFIVQGGGHFHVPVLLGPWGYTTYRGS